MDRNRNKIENVYVSLVEVEVDIDIVNEEVFDQGGLVVVDL